MHYKQPYLLVIVETKFTLGLTCQPWFTVNTLPYEKRGSYYGVQGNQHNAMNVSVLPILKQIIDHYNGEKKE